MSTALVRKRVKGSSSTTSTRYLAFCCLLAPPPPCFVRLLPLACFCAGAGMGVRMGGMEVAEEDDACENWERMVFWRLQGGGPLPPPW